ncbi:protein chibby homolog 1 isoform X1 [Nothoprocta perdicaria]|uniref:protein chibby homolog 1 isoform X1 n=1 Tax=Nothoprocta perdicaria TaxID=30464 RepID=UPI000E1BF837|nr:protein chibby homolog 1 isoform X1 [Nothoprocta perdicaria]
MPLFGNTFSPKKTPPRKSASLSNLHLLDRSTREVELGLEYGIPTMNLAGQSLKFENGQWVAESGSFTGDRREMQRLRKRNQQLEEENNLLRLKVDILLDMFSLQGMLCTLLYATVQEDFNDKVTVRVKSDLFCFPPREGEGSPGRRA